MLYNQKKYLVFLKEWIKSLNGNQPCEHLCDFHVHVLIYISSLSFWKLNFLDHNFPSAKVVGCAQSSIVTLVEVSQSQQK